MTTPTAGGYVVRLRFVRLLTALLAALTVGHTQSHLAAQAPRLIHTLQAHDDIVIGLAFSPDGKVLATGSQDKMAKVWDISELGKKPNLIGELKHERNVWQVCFNRTGGTLICSTIRNDLYFWDVKKKAQLARSEGHEGFGIRTLALHPKLDVLASAGRDREIILWDVPKAAVLRRLAAHGKKDTFGLAFSPDGAVLASCGGDRAIRMWDAETGKAREVWENAHPFGVMSIAFHPTGKVLASGGHNRVAKGIPPDPKGKPNPFVHDGDIRLWEVAKGRVSRLLQGHKYTVLSLAFSPDGKYLASGSLDHTARLWDVTKGECIAVLEGHTNMVTRVAFRPDGKVLATASSDKTVRLWAVPEKK